MVVVPSVDEVEIKAIGDGGVINVVDMQVSFPSSCGYGHLNLPVPSNGYKYVIQYRYHKSGESTQWLDIPSDTANGFYNEVQFDDNGDLISGPTRSVYTSSNPAGFIPVLQDASSYKLFTASLKTGDVFGYGTFELDNGAPGNAFEVGVDQSVQRCKGVRGGGGMTVPHIIGLKTAGALIGNSFTFIFDVGIDDAGFSLTVNDDFTSYFTPGTVIRTFSVDEMDHPYLTGRSIVLRCTFNGAAWEIYEVNGLVDKLGDIKMLSNVDMGDFSSGKAILGTRHQGWALCNGSNGTQDLRQRFIGGANYGTPRGSSYGTYLTAEFDNIGDTFGTHSVKLTGLESGLPKHRHASGTLQSPNHTHDVSGTTPAGEGGHSHNVQLRVHKKSSYAGSGNIEGTKDNTQVGNFTGNFSALNNALSHHTHSFSATTGNPSSRNITGDTNYSATSSSGTSATSHHESRPEYMVLGFVQRIKQS